MTPAITAFANFFDRGLLENVMEQASRGPSGWLRITGDAGWVLRDIQGCEELMAYEAKVNLLAPRYDCTVLCVYDINQCSGQVVADALATHSHVILGGRLHQNPHYMEPLEFLKKIALQRTHSSPLRAPAGPDRDFQSAAPGSTD